MNAIWTLSISNAPGDQAREAAGLIDDAFDEAWPFAMLAIGLLASSASFCRPDAFNRLNQLSIKPIRLIRWMGSSTRTHEHLIYSDGFPAG